MWGPTSDVCWFIKPLNLRIISIIIHSRWSYKLSQLSRGPHFVYKFVETNVVKPMKNHPQYDHRWLVEAILNIGRFNIGFIQFVTHTHTVHIYIYNYIYIYIHIYIYMYVCMYTHYMLHISWMFSEHVNTTDASSYPCEMRAAPQRLLCSWKLWMISTDLRDAERVGWPTQQERTPVIILIFRGFSIINYPAIGDPHDYGQSHIYIYIYIYMYIYIYIAIESIITK